MTFFNIKSSFKKLQTPLSSDPHLPFNFSGRFGRLSYITWTTLLFILNFILMIYLSMKLFHTDALDIEIAHSPDLLALFLLMIMYLFAVYLFFVFSIR